MKRSGSELQRLVSDAAWALRKGLGPRDLIPMLERVLSRAGAGSAPARFAQQHLARLLVEGAPWRAARLALDLLRYEDDADTWAVLGLAHTLLGNYRCARKAYYRALALSPGCPAYSHNLGHLLDVALGRPEAALIHLDRAHRSLPDEPEIASSYAHALLRVGQAELAARLLTRALDGNRRAADRVLANWRRAILAGQAGSTPV
jgi:tetratricopeptide (TPR) repeat protein